MINSFLDISGELKDFQLEERIFRKKPLIETKKHSKEYFVEKDIELNKLLCEIKNNLTILKVELQSPTDENYDMISKIEKDLTRLKILYDLVVHSNYV
jgi:ribosomal protein L29